MMKYIVFAVLVVFALFLAAMAVIMVATAIAVIAVVAVTAWIAWRILPFRAAMRIPEADRGIRRLKDHYVAGHIDLGEFERRVARVLAGR